MTDALKVVQSDLKTASPQEHSTLIETLKATSRLVPRQINDEIELAKIELTHKKSKLGVAAGFGAVALVFVCLLVVGLVVAAIAGLAVVLPLWLSALIICAALLVIAGIAALITVKKAKSLMPLIPEQAWRGIRYDLGIAKEGANFDPSTLDKPVLSKEEKAAQKAQAEADAAQAKAEREAKEAEHGPKANENELIKRTEARREHLASLRAELVDQADVKKQTGYALDFAKEKVSETPLGNVAGLVATGVDTAKTRWKPLAVFAVSATACAVLLRRLFKK